MSRCYDREILLLPLLLPACCSCSICRVANVYRSRAFVGSRVDVASTLRNGCPFICRRLALSFLLWNGLDVDIKLFSVCNMSVHILNLISKLCCTRAMACSRETPETMQLLRML